MTHAWQRRQWHPTPVLLPGKSHEWRSLVGCSPWGHYESDMTKWLHFHALEKEMATHSSVLAWRIPGMEEPGGLPSMGSHRVGHDWSNLAAAAACLKMLRRWHLRRHHFILIHEKNNGGAVFVFQIFKIFLQNQIPVPHCFLMDL